MPVWATHLGYHHADEESRRRSGRLVRSMTNVTSRRFGGPAARGGRSESRCLLERSGSRPGCRGRAVRVLPLGCPHLGPRQVSTPRLPVGASRLTLTHDRLTWAWPASHIVTGMRGRYYWPASPALHITVSRRGIAPPSNSAHCARQGGHNLATAVGTGAELLRQKYKPAIPPRRRGDHNLPTSVETEVERRHPPPASRRRGAAAADVKAAPERSGCGRRNAQDEWSESTTPPLQAHSACRRTPSGGHRRAAARTPCPAPQPTK